MKSMKYRSSLRAAVAILVSGLSACASKQVAFNYNAPDIEVSSLEYQEKPGWATKSFAVAAANPLATERDASR